MQEHIRNLPKQKQPLSDILSQNKLELRISPDDGHCLLHSIITSWNTQLRLRTLINQHKIKCSFFVEAVKNYEIYLAFLVDSNACVYFAGLRRYLVNKIYNHALTDAAP